MTVGCGCDGDGLGVGRAITAVTGPGATTGLVAGESVSAAGRVLCWWTKATVPTAAQLAARATASSFGWRDPAVLARIRPWRDLVAIRRTARWPGRGPGRRPGRRAWGLGPPGGGGGC